MGQLRQGKLPRQGAVKVCTGAASPPLKPAKSSPSSGENLLKRAARPEFALEEARPDLCGPRGAAYIEISGAQSKPKTRPECSYCHRTIRPDHADRADGQYECRCGGMFYVEHDGQWREWRPERNSGL